MYPKIYLRFSFSLKHKINKMMNFPVHDYQVGERLDRFLKKSPIGWIKAQKGLRKKQIIIKKLNGQLLHDKQYRLEKGDQIFMTPQVGDIFCHHKTQINSVSYEQAKSTLDKMMIYDNQHLSIVNKPHGYSVQGGSFQGKNLFTLMAAKYNKQVVHITHRLDKCTSGVVIIAKNRNAAQMIQKAMESRNMIHKFYIALTEGNKIQKSGYIRCNIQWAHGKARLSRQNVEDSRDCVTYYEPLELPENLDNTSFTNFLGLKLLTGRKHQIRCHLGRYLQTPIINDRKYGGKQQKRSKQQGQQTTQQQQQNQQEQWINLHALGIKITNNQIIQNLFNGTAITNNQLGQIKHQNDGLYIVGKPLQRWPNFVKQYSNIELVKMLDKNEIQAQKNKPRKRKIIQIS